MCAGRGERRGERRGETKEPLEMAGKNFGKIEKDLNGFMLMRLDPSQKNWMREEFGWPDTYCGHLVMTP